MTIYDLPQKASYSRGENLINDEYIVLDNQGNFMAKFYSNNVLIIARAFERCKNKKDDTFTLIYKKKWNKSDKNTEPFNNKLEKLLNEKK